MSENEAGQIIDLDQAKMYTYSFQEHFPEEIKAFTVSIEKIQAIIEQPNCKGIRIYNGFNEEKKVKNLVLIGYDHEDKDIDDGIIVEKLLACPPYCGNINNSLFKPQTDAQ